MRSSRGVQLGSRRHRRAQHVVVLASHSAPAAAPHPRSPFQPRAPRRQITRCLLRRYAASKPCNPRQAAALAYLHAGGARLELLAQGKAALGYAVLGPVGLLLLAESVRVSGVLPGGHELKTVVQSRWHRVALQVRTRARRGGSVVAPRPRAAPACSQRDPRRRLTQEPLLAIT